MHQRPIKDIGHALCDIDKASYGPRYSIEVVNVFICLPLCL